MKRKCYMIILLLCLTLSIIAQEDYHSFISEGKSWEIAHIGMLPSQQDKWVFMMNGDTIINESSYKKLYQENKQGVAYYRALREEDRKVYCIPCDSQEEHLLFDYGLKVGDSVYCVGGDRFDSSFITETAIDENQVEFVRFMKLTGIDTYTNKEGMNLKRYHFTVNIRSRHTDGSVTEYEEHSPVTWIEGIGTINDYTFNSWYLEMVSSYSWMLTKCYDSHHIFYDEDASRIADNNVLPQPLTHTIYDLQGRRLITPPSHGVYIRGGRKYVR